MQKAAQLDLKSHLSVEPGPEKLFISQGCSRPCHPKVYLPT